MEHEFSLGRRYQITLQDGETFEGTHIMGPAMAWFGDPANAVTSTMIVVKDAETGEHRFIRTTEVTSAERL